MIIGYLKCQQSIGELSSFVFKERWVSLVTLQLEGQIT